jgi:hypothetical protein
LCLDAEVGGKTSISKQKQNIRILEENEGNQKLMFGTEPSILLLALEDLKKKNQTSTTASPDIIHYIKY